MRTLFVFLLFAVCAAYRSGFAESEWNSPLVREAAFWGCDFQRHAINVIDIDLDGTDDLLIAGEISTCAVACGTPKMIWMPNALNAPIEASVPDFDPQLTPRPMKTSTSATTGMSLLMVPEYQNAATALMLRLFLSVAPNATYIEGPLPVAYGASAAAVADATGDGLDDAFVVSVDGTTWLINNGNDTFVTRSAPSVAYSVLLQIRLGKLFGTLGLDLLVFDNSVATYRTYANLTMVIEPAFAAQIPPIAGYSGDVVLAPFLGTALDDIALAYGAGRNNSFVVLGNDGANLTQVPTPILQSSGAHVLAAADLDGDGTIDLATCTALAQQCGVSFNNGTAFSALVEFEAAQEAALAASRPVASSVGFVYRIEDYGSVPASDAIFERIVVSGRQVLSVPVGTKELPVQLAAGAAAVGDFNKDGCVDVVALGANPYGPIESVLLGQCTGAFLQNALTVKPLSQAAAVLADFDGDSYPDYLAFGNGLSGIASDYRHGALLQSAADKLDATAPPVRIAAITAADFDGDGLNDALYSGFNSPTAQPFVVLLNNASGYLRVAYRLDGAVGLGNKIGVGATGPATPRTAVVPSRFSVSELNMFDMLPNGTVVHEAFDAFGQGAYTQAGDDLDGDGWLDVMILVAGYSYEVWFGLGNRTFGRQITVHSWDSALGSAVGTSSGSTVFILGGGQFVTYDVATGAGTTALPTGSVVYESNTGSLAAADFDNDGIPDVFVARDGECGFDVLLSGVAPPSDTTSSGTTSGGDGGDGSGDDESSFAAMLAGIIGGSTLFCVAIGGMVCAVCICVVILVVVCAICCVVVCIVAVGGTSALAVGGGGGTAGAGGVAIVYSSHSEKGSEDGWLMNSESQIVALEQKHAVERMFADTNVPRIDEAEIKVGARLARGSYGTVYHGIYKGVERAVKMIEYDGNMKAMTLVFAEASLMYNVSNHPNIVSLLGVSITSEYVTLIMEYCKYGSLEGMLVSGLVTRDEKKTMLKQIAAALVYLHREDIMHRDVAARNVLVDEQRVAKLSDFGMAHVFGNDEDDAGDWIGPVRWMAPEAIGNRLFTPASDVWAFGVLMWEVWNNGELPYREYATLTEVARAVQSGVTLSPPAEMPEVHALVMRNIFGATDSERPTMKTVLDSISTDYDTERSDLPAYDESDVDPLIGNTDDESVYIGAISLIDGII